MFTYLLTGSFREYSLLWAGEILHIYNALICGIGSSCPRFFPSSPGDFGGSFNISYHFNYCPANPGFGASPGVWREIRPISSRRHLSSKLIFFFSINADIRRGLFPLWDSSQSFSFYLLPLSGDPLGLLYVPYTPFFIHPVTECKHMLVSILTWIRYFSQKGLT